MRRGPTQHTLAMDCRPGLFSTEGVFAVQRELGGPVAPDNPINIGRDSWIPSTSYRQRVQAILETGSWFSLVAIARRVGCTEAGASARLRELRNKYGVCVERRRCSHNGRHYYRMGGVG